MEYLMTTIWFIVLQIGFIQSILTKLPSDVVTTKGSNTVFSCYTNLSVPVFIDYDTAADDVISFDSIYQGNPGSIRADFESRYGMNVDSKNNQYNLSIGDIQPHHAGTYRWGDRMGLDLKKFKEGEPGYGAIADLIIVENQLQCESNVDLKQVIEITTSSNRLPDKIVVTCTLSYIGNVAPTLEWAIFPSRSDSNSADMVSLQEFSKKTTSKNGASSVLTSSLAFYAGQWIDEGQLICRLNGPERNETVNREAKVVNLSWKSEELHVSNTIADSQSSTSPIITALIIPCIILAVLLFLVVLYTGYICYKAKRAGIAFIPYCRRQQSSQNVRDDIEQEKYPFLEKGNNNAHAPEGSDLPSKSANGPTAPGIEESNVDSSSGDQHNCSTITIRIAVLLTNPNASVAENLFLVHVTNEGERPELNTNALSGPETIVHEETAACSLNGDLYAVGLGSARNELWKWSQINGQWTKLPSMTKGRSRHSVAAVDNMIYVLGGVENLETIEKQKALGEILRYDVDAGIWYEEPCKLLEPVHSAACTTYNSRIYLFGGARLDSTFTRSTQLFDIHAKKCIECAAMPEALLLMRAVVHSSKAILVGRYTGYLYDFESNTWDTEDREQFATEFDHFGLSLYNDILYIMGGGTKDRDSARWTYTDEIKSLSVDAFVNNREGAEWEQVSRMTVPSLVQCYSLLSST